MTMFNRIKEYLDKRPDPVTGEPRTSAYRFWKETGLSRATAYRLYNDSKYIPTGEVWNAICRAYGEQPGIFVRYVSERENSND